MVLFFYMYMFEVVLEFLLLSNFIPMSNTAYPVRPKERRPKKENFERKKKNKIQKIKNKFFFNFFFFFA